MQERPRAVRLHRHRGRRSQTHGGVLPRTLGRFRGHQRIQFVTQQTIVQYGGIPLNRLPSMRQFLP